MYSLYLVVRSNVEASSMFCIPCVYELLQANIKSYCCMYAMPANGYY